MSCHTWCARKTERSIEVARKMFIYEMKKSIELWKELVDNPNDELRIVHNWSQDHVEHWLKVYERQLRMVEAGLCNVAVMNKQPDHSYYIPGKGLFIDCPEYGNQFRIRNYPTDELFSKDECLQFIERNKDKIEFCDDTYDRLDEFWDLYPDGYMHFG